MHCFQKSARSCRFLERAGGFRRGGVARPGRFSPGMPAQNGAFRASWGRRCGAPAAESRYLYAGGGSISLSFGISRLEPGAFSHVLSVAVASAPGVSAGPAAAGLNPMLSHEHSRAAAAEASIAIMTFFIAKLNVISPARVSQADFFWVRRVPAGGEMGGELAARRGFGGGTRKPQSEIFSAEFVNFPANRADTLNAVFAVALFFENLCLTCRKL